MTMMSGCRPGAIVSIAKYEPHRPKPDWTYSRRQLQLSAAISRSEAYLVNDEHDAFSVTDLLQTLEEILARWHVSAFAAVLSCLISV